MQLNKKLKEEIILKLVGKATKKHAQAMSKAAASLNLLWRQAVIKHAQQAIPELPQERWADLIQSQTFKGFGSLSVSTVAPAPLKGQDNRTVTNDIGDAGRRIQWERAATEKYQSIKVTMADNGWSGFFSVCGVMCRDHFLNVGWPLPFHDLPAFSWMSVVDLTGKSTGPAAAWSLDTAPLAEQANALTAKFQKVLVEAAEFYDSLQIIMASINTDTQLIDQFPEAAKFLPEQAPKRNQLAPTELIAKARQMLETGIPN